MTKAMARRIGLALLMIAPAGGCGAWRSPRPDRVADFREYHRSADQQEWRQRRAAETERVDWTPPSVGKPADRSATESL